MVWADDTQIRICDGHEVVAKHERCFDEKRRIEDKAHIEALLAEKRAAHRLHGQGRLQAMVPATELFLQRAAERGHNMGSVTTRMLDFLDEYGSQDLADVMLEINERQTVHVPAVRQLLEQRRHAQNRPTARKVELPSASLREFVVVPHDLRIYDALTEIDDEGDDNQ